MTTNHLIYNRHSKKQSLLLIPAMLDAHFPLLQHAFRSKNYDPVILENETGITGTGLKYVNNDMCYPIILISGQMIEAMRSGKYNTDNIKLLMPSAGDACRGSNYTNVLRRAVAKSGFDKAQVLTLNLKGLEKDMQLKLNLSMVWKALFGLFYGDILMLLLNQTRPNEIVKGSAQKLWQKWTDKLSTDIKESRHLSIPHMIKNFKKIAYDFSLIELNPVKKQRIGIVGELYIKYCHLGNWNMIKFLEDNDCESHTNGLSWYAMYYMDSHMTESSSIETIFYRIGLKFFGYLQKKMIAALREYNFYTMEDFFTMKMEARKYVSFNLKTGDGWLIAAEIVGHIKHDCKKVLAIQPFGCMANHCCGRGIYPFLQRNLDGYITSIDVDSGGSQLNVYNRVQMLIQQPIDSASNVQYLSGT